MALHHRLVGTADRSIDHLVIAPSGLWIIVDEQSEGKVERRTIGTRRATDVRVFVGGRDATDLVDTTAWQVSAVHEVIDPMGLGSLPVHRALCFSRGEWALFARPFQVRGVWIGKPSSLLSLVRMTGPLESITIETIAREVVSRMPPAA